MASLVVVSLPPVAAALLPHELKMDAATTDAANSSRTTDQDVTLRMSIPFKNPDQAL